METRLRSDASLARVPTPDISPDASLTPEKQRKREEKFVNTPYRDKPMPSHGVDNNKSINGIVDKKLDFHLPPLILPEILGPKLQAELPGSAGNVKL